MRGSKVGRRALDRVAPGGSLVQACDCLVGGGSVDSRHDGLVCAGRGLLGRESTLSTEGQVGWRQRG